MSSVTLLLAPAAVLHQESAAFFAIHPLFLLPYVSPFCFQYINWRTELSSKLSIYVLEEKSIKDSAGVYHWKYRKWSNGDFELWRFINEAGDYSTSHSSANNIYYSDEKVWFPPNNSLNVKTIEQTLATIDRKGNDGLPNVSVVDTYIQNGIPCVKFIVTGNKNTTYKASVNFYIRGTWK